MSADAGVRYEHRELGADEVIVGSTSDAHWDRHWIKRAQFLATRCAPRSAEGVHRAYAGGLVRVAGWQTIPCPNFWFAECSASSVVGVSLGK